MKEKKQLWQVIKFTLFSISAGIVQIGSFAVLFCKHTGKKVA